MSQYPNPPQPQPQWQGQWQPPPPHRDRHPGRGPGVDRGHRRRPVLVLGVFGVTAFAAPGFLVDDDDSDDSSSSSEPRSREEDKGGPGGQPDVPIPPPNASAPESEPVDRTSRTFPKVRRRPGTPPGSLRTTSRGSPPGCGRSGRGDVRRRPGVAVRGRGLPGPRAGAQRTTGDDTAPGGLLADLSGPQGTVDGRITWCRTTPTAGVSTCSTCSEAACPHDMLFAALLVAATAW